VRSGAASGDGADCHSLRIAAENLDLHRKSGWRFAEIVQFGHFSEEDFSGQRLNAYPQELGDRVAECADFSLERSHRRIGDAVHWSEHEGRLGWILWHLS